MLSKKRILICSGSAIMTAILTAYLISQLTSLIQTNQCITKLGDDWFQINKTICQTWLAPKSISRANTGFWFGLTLGAFISGLLTHK